LVALTAIGETPATTIELSDNVAIIMLRRFPLPTTNLTLQNFDLNRVLPTFEGADEKGRHITIGGLRMTAVGVNFSMIPGAVYGVATAMMPDGQFMTVPEYVFDRNFTRYARRVYQFAGSDFRDIESSGVTFKLPVTYPTWPGLKNIITSVYSRLPMVGSEYKAASDMADYYTKFLADVKHHVTPAEPINVEQVSATNKKVAEGEPTANVSTGDNAVDKAKKKKKNRQPKGAATMTTSKESPEDNPESDDVVAGGDDKA
jgi:hypothetical protein